MLNIKTLSILALAGSAAAAPQWMGKWADKYFGGNRGNGDDAAAVALEIVTQYTTVTYQGGWNGNYGGKKSETAAPVAAYTPAPTPSPAAPSPAAPSPKPVESKPKPVDSKPEPAASSSPAAPAASSSAPVASSGSSEGGYMGIVNTWRAKMGMSDLTHSDTLEANAIKTAVDGNGQMVHELNPGSFAQVLAPGSADEFEHVFVGGWLCERPNLSGLNGICTTMSQGWSYEGQTGHADILTSKSYSKIGCGMAKGIWGCDLA